MRDYQRKHNNPYRLPSTVWRLTLCQIRDYKRLKEEVKDLITVSEGEACPGKSNKPGDPIAAAAIRREAKLEKIKVIDDSLLFIPEEYRRGVARNILYGESYPPGADKSTYARYKQRFVYMVAVNLGFL